MPDINQNRTPERREQPGGQRQAPRSRARKRRRRPVWLTVIIRILQGIGTLLLVGVITGCFMVCFAAIYVKTAVLPEAHLDLSTYSLNENSVIYYQDKNTGQLVELQTLMGTENRELITYEQIPEDLINAFIAIEDKRFLTHNGVDWKRTAAGLLYMLTGRRIQGGSTITQQLIKNVTDYDDVTVNRKIWEIFTALDVENNYDKKYILTLYMNQIWMGNGCRGVQAASKYYFGKDVSDLTLAECASLAGITNNPGLYAPYGTVEVMRYTCRDCKDYYLNEKPATCESCGGKNFDDGVLWTNREYNKARQEIISPDGAYITEAERDAAIAQPLVFGRDRQNEPQDPEEGEGEGGGETPSTRSTRYSWYVEAVINESIQKLKEKTGLSYDMCEDMVLSGGLSIVCAYGTAKAGPYHSQHRHGGGHGQHPGEDRGPGLEHAGDDQAPARLLHQAPVRLLPRHRDGPHHPGHRHRRQPAGAQREGLARQRLAQLPGADHRAVRRDPVAEHRGRAGAGYGHAGGVL